MPNLVGRALTDSENQLRALGLTANTRVLDSDQTRGTIISQTPNPGTELARGSTVLLSVASGPAPAPVRGAADETQQLMRVLQRYKNAYESLDAKAVAAVYPSVNVTSLQAAFDQFSKMSYDVKVHIDVVNIDGQTATVTATETMRPVSRSVRAQADDNRGLYDAAVRQLLDDPERLDRRPQLAAIFYRACLPAPPSPTNQGTASVRWAASGRGR